MLRPGLNLVLRLEPKSDLDEIGRRLAAALVAEQADHALVWWDDEAAAPDAVFPGLHPSAAPFDSTLLCLNPLDLGTFAYRVPATFVRTRFTVALWTAEGVPAPELEHPASFLDEVWVASRFAARELATKTDRPVEVFPLPVTCPSTEPAARPSGLPEAFTFLSIVDLGPEGEPDRFDEANPLALVRAFLDAFPQPGGPTLVVRTIGGATHLDRLEELRLETERPDVVVIDGPLRPEERTALVRACDCYVSFHRVEESSLAALEALACGRPAIVTGFSGTLPSLEGVTQLLTGYRETPRPEPSAAWWCGPTWAEPDPAHAVQLLRWVYEQPDQVRDAVSAATAEVAREHSPQAAAAFVQARLAAGRELGGCERGPTPQAASTTPLERAVGYFVSGPSNSWDAPSRLGRAGLLLRRIVLRAIRPYTARREELDRAVVEALAQLNHRLHVLEERIDRSRDEPTPTDT
jgi:glycosyltransferase involved in cell wall biosynthesis